MRATHGGTVVFSRRLSKVTLLSLAAAAALVVFAPQAEAAQLKVPSQYATIQLAIDNANPGDKIKVAPGTYYEQVIIYKALTVEGSDGKKKVTIIDGSLTPLLAQPGQVRITANGDVKFSGFTVQNAGAASGVRFSIFAAGPAPGPMTYTISDNTIVGSGNDFDDQDYGFYTQNAYDTLVFTKNEISQTGSNPIVLELHYGASDVSHNTFDRGVSDGSVDAYFSMNYGGTDITTLQKVSHNKIDMGSGTLFTSAQRGFAISFAGAAFNLGNGRFTQVQVDHNDIRNLKPNRRGVTFWNDASPTDGGDITGVIADNKISGAPGDVTGTIGVRLIGLIADAVIEHNDLKKLDTGIQLRDWDGGNATGADISNNDMDVVLGVEAQTGASANQVTNNKIDASDPLYTVTLATGTSGNAVTGNHLRAGTQTGDATVLDLGSGNTVSGNKK